MTKQEAIHLLRTEQLGDSELMELAKQMGAMALERSPLYFVTPKCEKCGFYVADVMIKHEPALRNGNTMCLSRLDPDYCPKCHTPFVCVEIDGENQTCILKGPKEENDAT